MAYKRRDFKHLKEKKRIEEDFNNQLLHSQIEVQEQTFMQIGKELHDNVGQLLSTSRMLLGLTERHLKNPPDTLQTANETLGKAISELRSLSKSLDKEWLAQFNLLENLKAEVERTNMTGVVHASLNILYTPQFNSSIQIILFRIVQEAIQNAIKHSSCENINITISKNEKKAEIQIVDDGIGFNPQSSNKGMGLTNMKYRTQLLKGELQYQSQEKGTKITIFIPENQ